MKKIFLFICTVALFASTLACSLSSLTGPHLTVTLAPESGNAWDDATLTQARDVILSRLKSVGVKGATASISSDGNLQINLPTSTNVESVYPLLTQKGEITFIDSLDSLQAGDTVGANLEIVLTSRDIKNASITLDSVGGFQITFKFTSEGSRKLTDFTSNNIEHYLILACDGMVISSPRVISAITEGEAIIQGNLTQESANELAILLNNGTLPFPLVILDTSITK